MTRLLFAVSILGGLLSGTAGAATYETIHTVTSIHLGPGAISGLYTPLLFNSTGTAIYGIDADLSDIYKLTRPEPGSTKWGMTTVYTYPKGCSPQEALAEDKKGNLYGIMVGNKAPCSSFGLAIEVSPPAKGKTLWTAKTIYDGFSNAAAFVDPDYGLLVDSAGNLYGAADDTNSGNGAVYKLSPPAAGKTQWTGTELGVTPDAAWLQRDAGGRILGTGLGSSGRTGKYGVVWQLIPLSNGTGSYRYSILASLARTGADGGGPAGLMAVDRDGNVYGTAQQNGKGQGTVFEIAATDHTVTVLHSFKGSDGAKPYGLAIDSKGNLYGVATYGGNGWNRAANSGGEGTIYELSPPAKKGGVWGFKVLHAPQISFFDTSLGTTALNPHLVVGPDGVLYGTANGPNGTGGSIFRIRP